MIRQLRPFSALLLFLVLSFVIPAPAPGATLRIGGTGASLALTRVMARAFARSRADVEFYLPPSLGSGGGIRALLAGALDIAMSSRPLKAAERQAGAAAIPYARTPLVFVIRRDGPAPALASAEVAAIYGLRRRAWPDGSPIRILLRPVVETDIAALVAHFPGVAQALESTRALETIPVAQTDQENLDMAEHLPGSFTLAALTTVQTEHRHLTVLPLDGVQPSVANLERGRYTFAKTLYLVNGPHPSALVRAFIRFVRGARGARLLRESGCLPVSQ